MKKALAHKMGELVAFSRRGADIFEDNKKLLREAFKATELQAIITQNKKFQQELLDLAAQEKVTAEVKKKAQKSEKKLKNMQKVYLEGKKDPTEILEWLGFFEGSAMVHWSLVGDLAKKEKVKALSNLGKEAEKFHKNLLNDIAEVISSTEE